MLGSWAIPRLPSRAEVYVDSDEKDRLLAYVQARHARLSKRSAESGLTTWALLLALAYLLLRVPELLSKPKPSNWPASFLPAWAHLQAVLVLGYMFAMSMQSKNPSKRFDYRFWQARTGVADVSLAITACFLLVGLPAVLAAFSTSTSAKQHWVLLSNEVFFGGVFVVVVLLISWGTFRQSTFPSINLLVQEPARPFRIASGLGDLGIAAFLLANLYFTVDVWVSDATGERQHIHGLAITAALASTVLLALVSTLFLPRSLDSLERLERDIVIHGIDASEIRERLQVEHLGSAIGDWLNAQVIRIRRRISDLELSLTTAEEHMSQATSLDQNLRNERTGRLSELVADITARTGELRSDWDPLSDWLQRVASHPAKDRFLQEVVQETSGTLKDEVEQSLQQATDRLIESRRLLGMIDR
jgi:hypothetical protein